MRSNVCAFLAILLCTSAAARAFAAASLTPLGYLPGGSNSSALGVSGNGSVVVGWSYSSAGIGSEAFRWTSGGGMVGLGFLPGGGNSEAYGVSTDGSVVVGFSYGQAFRWTSGGGMVGLGYLPGRTTSWARGVSGHGSVVVGSSSSGTEAFRWTSGGGVVGLGYLPGRIYSVATAASGDGSTVVGWGQGSDFRYEAFRWTSGGGMVGLGYLPGGGIATDSIAFGVSGDGSVIVGRSSSASGGQAFRWTSDGGMVGLGNGVAYGVSGDGSVVVGVGGSGGAFYWTADGGMRALRDVLLSHGVDPAADGWSSLGANGISADGSTIVGSGIRNGNTEAFVAVIPIEPSGPPGDYNEDGVVDAADYVVWRKNNIDGESGYNTWRANFGATAAGAAAVAHSPTSVPEPATGALALLAVSGLLLDRRRSCADDDKAAVPRVSPSPVSAIHW